MFPFVMLVIFAVVALIALVSESLTPEILPQRYVDAIQNGTVFVVPEGSTPFIQP